jgi:ferredoxin-like protein FixX
MGSKGCAAACPANLLKATAKDRQQIAEEARRPLACAAPQLIDTNQGTLGYSHCRSITADKVTAAGKRTRLIFWVS